MANPRREPVAGRAIAVLLALVMGALALPGAATAAPSKQDVADARAAVQRLRQKIADEQAQLSVLGEQVNEINEDLLIAQDKLDAITTELMQTREHRAEVQAKFDEVVGRLNQRAHDAYIQGPGSDLEFILGATSLTDLSDRVTFLDAVQQSDADLATQVENLRNELDTTIASQEHLQVKQASVVNDLNAKKAELQESFDQQRAILDQIQRDEAAAQAEAQKINQQYEHWLKTQLAPASSNGILKVCPVAQPRSFGDGFGAPRYAGGFHLHKGVDIIAPTGTAIYAPFDGTARSSYNTLGGNAVYVTGASGYVYNAHLSSYSANSDGPVKAGTVIGYVGTTGDAQGGVAHDHFEYHPNVIPPNWPASAYGYSVIDDAINPYPLLVQACL